MISDIDLIASRWHNNVAIIGGTLTSFATTLIICKVAECVLSRVINWDKNRVIKGIVLITGGAIGLASGHTVTVQVIGLIAQSAIAKHAISLFFSGLGTLAAWTIFQLSQKCAS